MIPVGFELTQLPLVELGNMTKDANVAKDLTVWPSGLRIGVRRQPVGA